MSSKYDKKYGIVEDEVKVRFHRSRRMFCIKDNKLYIAEPNLPYSHAFWFEKMGWMDEKNDKLMDSITRGYVDEKGDVYFYKGYDFRVDEKSEQEMHQYIGELMKRLNLKNTVKLFGGLYRKNNQTFPIKNYGFIVKFIKTKI